MNVVMNGNVKKRNRRTGIKIITQSLMLKRDQRRNSLTNI